MFDWRSHQVCLAEGPADTHVLLALRPERLPDVGGDGETVAWDDGDHSRAFPLGRVLEDDPDRFRFEDDRGGRFTLTPLTAERYAERVRDAVGGPDLPTDAAVRAFYLAARPW